MKDFATRNSIDFWLEQDEPVAGQVPASDPMTGATAQNQQAEPNVQPAQEDDVTQDPQEADVPEDKETKDFEQWRRDFFDLSIKADLNNMLRSIQEINERTGLEASQKRFIFDNLQILLYRQDANVQKATKQIRQLIADDLDRTNPGTTVMQHITSVLETEGLLQQVLIKLTGLYGLKGELHRKFIAALLGAVQVGGGTKNREDLIYAGQDYTINLSTRFYTQFGEITLGAWSLKEDDPDKYLSDPELQRLKEGSPEERQVLRRRIIMESIAEKFLERAFLIHIVETDGTTFSLGWDLGTSLSSAYKDGKLVVRGTKSETKDAQINDAGEIVSLIDYQIKFVKESGETENGKPSFVELPFLEREDGILNLTADMDTIRNAASSMNGIFFKESPYSGNTSDLEVLRACTVSLSEILNRRCLGAVVPETAKKVGRPTGS